MFLFLPVNVDGRLGFAATSGKHRRLKLQSPHDHIFFYKYSPPQPLMIQMLRKQVLCSTATTLFFPSFPGEFSSPGLQASFALLATGSDPLLQLSPSLQSLSSKRPFLLPPLDPWKSSRALWIWILLIEAGIEEDKVFHFFLNHIPATRVNWQKKRVDYHIFGNLSFPGE